MSWFAGTLLERPPGPKYAKVLTYAELCPATPLPKPKTLTKWRRQLSQGFHLSLRAPSTLWRADDKSADDSLKSSIAWLAESADALRASLVVLPTGSMFTTGQRDRERLAELVEKLGSRLDAPIVWLPGGLWEPVQALRFAGKIGAVCGVDGIDVIAQRTAEPATTGTTQDTVYTFFDAKGARRSFPPSVLAEHVEQISTAGPSRVFTTIASHRSFDEAKSLQQMFDETRA